MRRSRHGVGAAAVGLCLALIIGLGASASESTEELPALLFGVVRLAGSELALSAEQAAQMLPQVQAWRSWVEEVSNVDDEPGRVAAIRAILTPEQAAAIDAMDLTSTDAIRWSSGALAAIVWRHSVQAGAPLPPGPLAVFAGRVVRLLSGWAAAG